MRYVNIQPHKSSCGPVAIINALKWLGCSTSYRKMLPFFNWNTEEGMHFDEMTQDLRKLGLRFKVVDYPTIKDMERELDKGRALVYAYYWFEKFERSGHYVFVDRHTPKMFSVKNNSDVGRAFLSKSKVTTYARKCALIGGVYPKMWVIISERKK